MRRYRVIFKGNQKDVYVYADEMPTFDNCVLTVNGASFYFWDYIDSVTEILT